MNAKSLYHHINDSSLINIATKYLAVNIKNDAYFKVICTTLLYYASREYHLAIIWNWSVALTDVTRKNYYYV